MKQQEAGEQQQKQQPKTWFFHYGQENLQKYVGMQEWNGNEFGEYSYVF